MLRNPFLIEIKRAGARYVALEIIPVYREEKGHYTPSGIFRIYAENSDNDDHYCFKGELGRQYFDDLKMMGIDNPFYLGELHFNGFAFFEWKYKGVTLSTNEVWQIVDLIQNTARTISL